MNLTSHNWILSVGTFLPIAGVLLLMIIPKKEELLIKQVAVSTSWIKPIRATYTIGLDGISLPLYILSMIITLLVMIYSWNHIPEPGNPKAFFSLMLVLQVGMAGTFIAQ